MIYKKIYIFKKVFASLDLAELDLEEFFDLSKWNSIKPGQINKSEMSDELKLEKDRVSNYIQSYILNNYKYQTTAYNLLKTSDGYSFHRYCTQYKNKSCKCKWNIRIDIQCKLANIDCKFVCNHTSNFI